MHHLIKLEKVRAFGLAFDWKNKLLSLECQGDWSSGLLTGPGAINSWVLIPALTITSFVTLGKLLNLSASVSPVVKLGKLPHGVVLRTNYLMSVLEYYCVGNGWTCLLITMSGCISIMNCVFVCVRCRWSLLFVNVKILIQKYQTVQSPAQATW